MNHLADPSSDSADREIVISRIFKAPRALVFDALIDRDHIGAWWGPNGFTTTTKRMEVRPGGEWIFVMHGPGGVDFPNRIRYRDIVRPERLVYDQGGETPDAPVHFQVTITLAEHPDGTALTMRSVFPTKAARDHVVDNYGAIDGGKQHLRRLADHLAHTSDVDREEGRSMARVRVAGFTLSLDGYGSGPHQDLGNPLGVGGTELHQWLVPTRTFQRSLFGADGGTTGIDDDFAARGFANIGAWILGRNMFGPIRGPWTDMDWKGWWGGNPPYHVPTFILTHHARAPITMEGGTIFHFVTGGIHEALDHARAAANGMDVRIGGGASTIRHYLRAGLIDELHIAISPVLLGGGERLFEGIDMRALGYQCVQFVASEKASHAVLRRQGHRDA